MPSGSGGDDRPGALYRPGRRDLLKVLGIGGVAALAGCSSSQNDGSGGGTTDSTESDGSTASGDGIRTVGGDYVSASSVDASSLNWISIADQTSGNYIGLTLDATWVITPDQEIFPLWADISSEDGRVYEVSLRDNLQWGAGYGQMTAEDWVYMIQEVFQAPDNWSGYPNTDDWYRNDEPIPVEQTGTLTFEIRLPEVDPSFPFKPVLWGQSCMPRGILEKYAPSGDTQGLQQDEEVNTLAYAGNLGPYSYEQWERESQFVVTRNEDYYLREVAAEEGFEGYDDAFAEAFAEAPYFDRYVIRVIKEESARLGALRSGEVTSAGVPPNKAEQFRNLSDIELNVTPQPFVAVLAYNQRANGWKPFRRKAVRQALAHAVDKQAIAESIYRGYARPAQTMQPEWSEWYVADRITNYGVGDNYGAEATRSALSEALSDTEYSYDGETLEDGNGEQVTLSLFFDQGQNTEQTTAEFIAQEFGNNAGIDVELQATSSFIESYASNAPPEGEDVPWSAGMFNGGPRNVSVGQEPWDMSVNLGFNTYPYTPASSQGFFEERGGINYYGYVPDADIAGLYEQASRTVDEAERRELFGRAFGLINDEQPFGFVTMSSSISGYDSTLQGPIEDFASGWDFQRWYFE
ncbi:ABC transporter substrate-binding protein [Salinigranum sp. GCM10025319]|uniref:ABC transporter substrate-binding protein n=1 Tax=Salinigranum sp. GCM10025319 TaxID=3252687 RepID=UPI00361473A8